MTLRARGGRLAVRGIALPERGWVASFDLALDRGSQASVTAGGGNALSLIFGRAAHARSVATVLDGGRFVALRARRGWPVAGGWHHIELEADAGSDGSIMVDGRRLPALLSTGGRLQLVVASGRAQIRALIVSSRSDRAALLLHRLAEIHARIGVRAFPFGSSARDVLDLHSSWTSGFWPGALWQAAALEPAGGMFARWALASTLAHLGHERTPTHDVGFMYGESSLLAYRALCGVGRVGRARRAALCSRLRRSVLAAADELVALARTNPGAGTIPTNARGPIGETIVDSMMNITILTWATSVTGSRRYARLASHQAHVIAALLVRPDGSTFQAVHFNRSSGRIVFIGTHQGLADSSTWSRGQGWAVYGFSMVAASLRDRGLLRVAQRLAEYVAAHLPPSGVPRWDYDAPPGAPVDVSAGVITAAGLLHLAAACPSVPGVCSGDSGRWVALARRMILGALAYARARPPLGLLGSQVLDGRSCGGCGGRELIFGLTYALEALHLSATSR